MGTNMLQYSFSCGKPHMTPQYKYDDILCANYRDYLTDNIMIVYLRSRIAFSCCSIGTSIKDAFPPSTVISLPHL